MTGQPLEDRYRRARATRTAVLAHYDGEATTLSGDATPRYHAIMQRARAIAWHRALPTLTVDGARNWNAWKDVEEGLCAALVEEVEEYVRMFLGVALFLGGPLDGAVLPARQEQDTVVAIHDGTRMHRYTLTGWVEVDRDETLAVGACLHHGLTPATLTAAQRQQVIARARVATHGEGV